LKSLSLTNIPSTFLLFVALVAMQTATSYMISDRILRSSAPTTDKAKLRRKEKKSSEIFMIFYYLPFSLAALYFMNLKIFDYFLIASFYWLLLKNRTIPSACTLGLLIYYNVLYADFILVALFVMMNQPVRNKLKYILCCGSIFLCLNIFDNYLTGQYVSLVSIVGRLSM
jgi:hypothetical protein